MIDTFSLLANTGNGPSKALKPDDPALQQYLTFTDRESYLAWRAEWKETYKQLSVEIRRLRKEWRAEGSNHSWKLHHDLFRNRDLARSMLALRQASKVKAAALWEAERAAVEVA